MRTSGRVACYTVGMLVSEVESRPMWKLDTGRMRELREAVPLTQAQAADKAGMSKTRWNDIEAGGRANVTIDTLGVIADALGCQPADLLKSTRVKRK